MKKIISISVLLSLLSIFSIAHTASAQLRIGTNFGFNFSNMVLSDEGGVGTYDTKFGARWGISAKYEIKEYLDIVGSVLYSVKGFVSENGIVTDRHFNYIEVPVQVMLKKPLSPKIKLMGIGGLYAGLGISGVYDPFSKDGLGYNPIDFGLILGTGVEIKERFQVRLAFEPGLADLAISEENTTLLNQVITLDFACFFGKK